MAGRRGLALQTLEVGTQGLEYFADRSMFLTNGNRESADRLKIRQTNFVQGSSRSG
ncbi:MAG: hypothetical protein ABR548_07665 [Actinomycetota bacterium]|nr:hypothetical protein [Actinomycetota bacterium]